MKPATVQDLNSLYVELVSHQPQYREASASIITALNTMGFKDPVHYIQNMVAEKPFIIRDIQDKMIQEEFYRMSSILYVYAGIDYSPVLTERAIQGYYRELESVGLDLGKVI